MRVRLGVLLTVVSGALSIGAGEAAAALDFCESPSSGRSCARLTVPLDPTGKVPGTVTLHIEREKAERSTRPPLFLVVGGPGESATAALDRMPTYGGEYAIDKLIGAERRKRDVVVIDLRGSGRSGPLNCPGVQRGHTAAIARCAAKLGPRRDFYTAADMAEDVDAVRDAIGAERIALLGVSYGTHVALTYARRHPARVERLVLDSPVGPLGIDPFQRSSSRAAPRVVAALCGRRECSSFTRDPAADTRRVAARLERGPLRGRMTGPDGRRRRASIDGSGLMTLLLASDFDPLLAATVPAALRRAAQGDPALLLRAAWAARRSEREVRAPVRVASAAARLATVCSDSTLPGSSGTPPAERLAAAAALAERIGPDAFAPFGPRTAVASEVLRSCAQWPSSARPAATLSALPDIPTLIFSGAMDLHSPTEDARVLAAQLPRSELSVMPGAGHGVIGTSGSGCPSRAVERFLAGGAPRSCSDESWNSVLAPPPRAFGDLPTGGMPPRVGQTVSATLWTAFDLATAFAQRARVPLTRPASRGRPGLRMRLGALHGGSYILSPKGIEARRARVVPGVEVSGSVRIGRGDRVRMRLRVRGRSAARGWLELRRGFLLVGRLGGRRVSTTTDYMHLPFYYWDPDLLRGRGPAAGGSPY